MGANGTLSSSASSSSYYSSHPSPLIAWMARYMLRSWRLLRARLRRAPRSLVIAALLTSALAISVFSLSVRVEKTLSEARTIPQPVRNLDDAVLFDASVDTESSNLTLVLVTRTSVSDAARAAFDSWHVNGLLATVTDVLILLVAHPQPVASFSRDLPEFIRSRARVLPVRDSELRTSSLQYAEAWAVGLARTELVLLLTLEQHLVEPPDVTRRQLDDGRRILLTNTASVVRFSHRWKAPSPPDPMHVLYHNRERQLLRERASHACISHTWLTDPQTQLAAFVPVPPVVLPSDALKDDGSPRSVEDRDSSGSGGGGRESVGEVEDVEAVKKQQLQREHEQQQQLHEATPPVRVCRNAFFEFQCAPARFCAWHSAAVPVMFRRSWFLHAIAVPLRTANAPPALGSEGGEGGVANGEVPRVDDDDSRVVIGGQKDGRADLSNDVVTSGASFDESVNQVAHWDELDAEVAFSEGLFRRVVSYEGNPASLGASDDGGALFSSGSPEQSTLLEVPRVSSSVAEVSAWKLELAWNRWQADLFDLKHHLLRDEPTLRQEFDDDPERSLHVSDTISSMKTRFPAAAAELVSNPSPLEIEAESVISNVAPAGVFLKSAVDQVLMAPSEEIRQDSGNDALSASLSSSSSSASGAGVGGVESGSSGTDNTRTNAFGMQDGAAGAVGESVSVPSVLMKTKTPPRSMETAARTSPELLKLLMTVNPPDPLQAHYTVVTGLLSSPILSSSSSSNADKSDGVAEVIQAGADGQDGASGRDGEHEAEKFRREEMERAAERWENAVERFKNQFVLIPYRKVVFCSREKEPELREALGARGEDMIAAGTLQFVPVDLEEIYDLAGGRSKILNLQASRTAANLAAAISDSPYSVDLLHYVLQLSKPLLLARAASASISELPTATGDQSAASSSGAGDESENVDKTLVHENLLHDDKHGSEASSQGGGKTSSHFLWLDVTAACMADPAMFSVTNDFALRIHTLSSFLLQSYVSPALDPNDNTAKLAPRLSIAPASSNEERKSPPEPNVNASSSFLQMRGDLFGGPYAHVRVFGWIYDAALKAVLESGELLTLESMLAVLWTQYKSLFHVVSDATGCSDMPDEITGADYHHCVYSTTQASLDPSMGSSGSSASQEPGCGLFNRIKS